VNIAACKDYSTVVIVHEKGIAAYLVEFAILNAAIGCSVKENSTSPKHGPVRPEQWFLVFHKRAGGMTENKTLQMDVIYRSGFGTVEFNQIF